MNRQVQNTLLGVTVVLVFAATSALGADNALFLRLGTQSEFLGGTLDGVAVDPIGVLSLADRVDKVTDLEAPFVFSLAEHPDGWVVGTGNSGQVFLVERDGDTRELFSAEESEIFAVWADTDGVVYAGSSPDGKVYRWSGGDLSVIFDPEEVYIWDLAPGAEGSLLVATGLPGRLYSVSRRGQASLLYDTEDSHLRAIKALRSGDVLMGTAGEGLLLRWNQATGVRTLYDSVHPEVVALAEGDGGTCYAAVLASEASLMDLSRRTADEKPGSDEKAEAPNGKTAADSSTATGSVSVTTSDAGFTGSRPAAFAGSRSEILRISPAGVVETLWSFSQETAYSLAWQDQRLWVGTGLDGKLFSLRDGQMVLEKDIDERQIVALAGGATGPALASTNGAAVFQVTGQSERTGVYTSPSLDAKQVSNLGTLSWLGDQPKGTLLRFSARSGLSAEPDRTWSAWSAWQDGSSGGVGLPDVPAGRYLQWRSELTANNGSSPVLTGVVVSYRQHNLAPRVTKLEVLDPGQVLVPSNFNPGNQAFEPFHPNREGIFTSLEPAKTSANRSKTLWKRGYRTLKWEASDPNEDELNYALHFRQVGAEVWHMMHEGLEETSLSFDSTVLPDGRYRFRLSAKDRGESASEEALSDEQVSRTVVVDHSSPQLGSVKPIANKVRFEVRDALSPLIRVEVSFNAEAWGPLVPIDGLLDQPDETLEVEIPAGSDLVLLRVMDAAFNSTTFDLLDTLKESR